nr:hypothetical protein [Tanacetum cinerariifolium]
LTFCDYHNMIAILEKYEHNVDFHQIVDFVVASHIRRNLKLNDEEGISTLPDVELFENLALMGVNSPSFLGRTVPLFDTMLVTQGEGSGTPTEPHHTPSLEAQQSPHTATSSPSLPPATNETILTLTPTEIPTLRQYSRRARIAQSTALPTAADKPASPLRDDSQGEACPTISGLEAGQDRTGQTYLRRLPCPMTQHQGQQTEMATKIAAQDLEISNLKARIKMLEDKDGGSAKPSGEDALIKGRSLETRDEAGVERSTEKGSKEKMVESDTPKKKLQEQIDVHVAREMEEQMAIEDQRRNEQITRDAEITRIHAEEELQMIIDGLDRNNEMIAKHLHEYEDAATKLTIGEKIELINELVKYQDHHSKILKYQAQQSKPLSKKQQREFYMSVLKSHSGWKTKHFKGERFKRKGLRLEQGSAKKMKTAEDVFEEDLKEMMHLVPVEEIIRLGGSTAVYQFFMNMLKHFEREDLIQLWTLVKETLSIRQATSDKEKELWVDLKRLFEPDVEDQL